MKEDRLYLAHILERIALIEAFVSDGRKTFEESALVQEAVLRCLEVIGEAARKVSSALRDQHPEIPWAQMVALRNILIHNYEGISLEQVWEIVENDLPPLKQQATTILAALDSDSDPA